MSRGIGEMALDLRDHIEDVTGYKRTNGNIMKMRIDLWYMK